MKRLLVLIIVWTLLVVTGTFVSADGESSITDSNSRQTVSNITEASDGIR